ncbi:ATP-binding protein [Streptomyces murinus]|uniref:Anti-sigma regulatory factor (Ser/Thr protein kinase) n=1 Tax=Streptomyces murinus TaxID=33900 RepID=A0A7W3NI04_STRMR|nr:ATP-binding protein [Streptomyces murinus]MBA9050902.1 anti-sigma regulatory factor (Ser/Thr protein kinase) [Streptomyces murinus]
MSGTNLAQNIKALFDGIPLVEWPRNESCIHGPWRRIDEPPSMPMNEQVRLRRSPLVRPEVLGMTPRALVPSQGVRTVLEVVIERRPDPGSGHISEADAIWPQRLRRIAREGLTQWGYPEVVETAELLLTELATNALRHGSGPDISVCVCLKDGLCVIEVCSRSSGCPEVCQAGPTDEGGRGLFLVDALAAAWGVSTDGTTTWCTLPLPEEPSVMELAAATAPVLREIPVDLPGDSSAATSARIQARTLLTVLGWPGEQDLAVDVLHVLVDNAVQHARASRAARQCFGACLSITGAHELLIDVTDPNPTFPAFDKAITGELGRDIWGIVRQGATLTWFARADFAGKTVRAVLRPGQVVL